MLLCLATYVHIKSDLMKQSGYLSMNVLDTVELKIRLGLN